MVEDSQCDGRLANPSGTNESDGFLVPCEADDHFNKLIAPETVSRRRGRQFSAYARNQFKVLLVLEAEGADLL